MARRDRGRSRGGRRDRAARRRAGRQRRRLVRGLDARTGRPNSVSVTYLEAIREAQAHLLREDERVFIYGQDIAGKFGGAFKATKGLAEQFPGRVLNTPISEDAMVGTAIGAAMEGMRPIVEMQFADFSSIALNQILNNAGTQYWRTQHSLPDHGAPAVRRNERQRPVPQPEHGRRSTRIIPGWSSSRRRRSKTPTRC